MIFDRLTQSPGLRADVSWHPLDDRWYQADPSTETFSGFRVGPDTAKRVSAVFACASKIAEIVASTPRALYRRLDDKGAKVKATEHPAYRAIRYRPNAWLSAMDYYAGESMRLCLRGNCYSEIRYRAGRFELWPLHPALVTVEQVQPSGRLRYHVRDPKGGRPRTLIQDEVLHVRDLYEDGIAGQARAVLAREAIAVAAAGEAFVGGFFKHDATGRLVLEHPGNLPTKERRDEFESSVRAQYSGWQNARRPLVLYGGMKAQEIGGLDDGKFILEPRKFQVADVARYWGVPLWLIGLEEKSTSWGSGIEQQLIAFVSLTIKAWADRWAQAMMLALLDEDEQDEYVIEFNFKDLVRGDIKSRFEAYQIGRNIGMYSPNDLLRFENEPPREGGDTYQDTIQGAPPNAAAGAEVPPDDDDDEDEEPQAARIPAPLLADAARRISYEETKEIGRRASKAGEDGLRFVSWARTFCHAQREYAARVLTPLAEAYGVSPRAIAQAVDRIAQTAIAALGPEGVPDGWIEGRRAEVAQLLDDTFQAAVARAA